MTPQRWAVVKTVVAEALERPEAERRQFLDQACGSEAWLREEAERLLAAPDSRSFESPLAGAPRRPEDLISGQALGRYRVEAKLGQGGMGAVYRAWDAQLQRSVAVKVLSTRYFDDDGQRQRFLREARAASALNHPNIVTIHEVGSEAGIDFIAMEYIDGQTLDRLIPASGLPLQRALDYAVAVAGALAKAHATGIVHRDLKPVNIMVTGDGLVKLLDFGLARRVRLSGSANTTLSRDGEIVGTPAYMSPEQAEGKPADERSDVFSFGVVLYEMLSGRRAFPGDSTVAILGAVLKEEPPPLRGVPAELEKLVSRCLRKEPAARLRQADDIRILLEDIRRDASKAVPAPLQRGKLVRLVALVIIATCTGIAVWLVAQPWKQRGAEIKVVPLTTYLGSEIQPSFSPDGKQIAFAWDGENQANHDIYVKVVGSEAAPLRVTSDPAPDGYPAWSPDGRQIAFVRSGGVYLVSPLGGAERKLADLQRPGFGVVHDTLGWSPDGKWLVASDGPWEGPRVIVLISADSGDKRVLFSDSAFARAPSFDPDGRRMAFVSCTGPMGAVCDLHLLELEPGLAVKGKPRRLTHVGQTITSLAWTSDGRYLIYAAAPCQGTPSQLWRVGVSGNSRPERLDFAGRGAVWPTTARTGSRLAFAQRSSDVDIWELRSGSVTPVRLIASTWDEFNPQFSPDGKKVAFASDRSGGCPEIWISNRDGSNPLQLTNDQLKYKGTPRWSPDGYWIAFDQSSEDGHSDVYLVDSNGGRQRRLTTSSSDESVPSWSRDGRWIYFKSNRSGEDEIWKMPFEGGQAVQVTTNGGYVSFESWDGRDLYYLKTAYGPGQTLFKRALAGGPEQVAMPGKVGYRAFMPVSDGIYYVEPGPKRDGPDVFKFYERATGRTQVLGTVKGGLSLGLAVSPDRKSMLFAMGQSKGADLMFVENFR